MRTAEDPSALIAQIKTAISCLRVPATSGRRAPKHYWNLPAVYWCISRALGVSWSCRAGMLTNVSRVQKLRNPTLFRLMEKITNHSPNQANTETVGQCSQTQQMNVVLLCTKWVTQSDGAYGPDERGSVFLVIVGGEKIVSPSTSFHTCE